MSDIPSLAEAEFVAQVEYDIWMTAEDYFRAMGATAANRDHLVSFIDAGLMIVKGEQEAHTGP